MLLLCADLASVVDGDLLRQDDDLAELGVDPDQFGHAVPDATRRQVDDSGVEVVPGVKSLPHAVEDRDVARLGDQHLALVPR